ARTDGLTVQRERDFGVEIDDTIRAIRPAKLEQNAVCGGFWQTGRAESQVTAFGSTNANTIVGEDFGMPVVARGDVDNQAGRHKQLQKPTSKHILHEVRR